MDERSDADGAPPSEEPAEGDERLPTETVKKPPIGGLSNLPTERPRISDVPVRDILGQGEKTTRDQPGENPFANLLAEARAPKKSASSSPTPTRNRAPSGPTTAETKSPMIQERRVGPYRVLEELGSGGMAVVYKALQPALDRLVAIKELRSEYVNDRQIATRFEREATSLATLQHGNIVHIYDYLHDEESAYIVMEYVDGIDLFDVLSETERVPPEIAGLIALGVAEGLEYAHFTGIVHRDIKPSNILISKKGEVKIMDFGIARDPGKSELTQVGLAVGTPAYMAPEQIRGDQIDFRTDVFAFGIVLYEMVAGEKPWTEEQGRSVTVKVLDEEYPPIQSVVKNVPPELVRVIDRSLAKNASQRYQTTYELRRDLELFVQRTVPIDPRGRLVLFLRNRNFITEAEASNLVDGELLDDASLRRRDEGIPLPPAEELLRPIGIAHAAGVGAVLLALLLALLAPFGRQLPEVRPELVPRAEASPPDPVPKGQDDQPEKAEAPPAKADEESATGPHLGRLASPNVAPEGDRGYVKVVVSPWARVFVDGEFHDYTPFSNPIALPPGEHTIGLRNPYFKAVDRVIVVEKEKTTLLKQALLPKEGTDAH